MMTSQPMPLLPEVASLCGGATDLAESVRGQAQSLASLACLMTMVAPAGLYALGWSPAHVMGWTPYVQAEMAATVRRATRGFLEMAA